MSGIAEISKKYGRKKRDDSSFLIKRLDAALYSPESPPQGGNRRFYASSIGNLCDRYLYLQFHGLLPQKEINGNLRRIFDHGNVTQDRYKSYFKKMGVFLQDEIEAKTQDALVSGRADFLLHIEPEFPKYIVELKTINSQEFGSLSEPKLEHVAQIQFYLFVLNVQDGGVLYENKDNQKIKLFHVHRDKEYMISILERCKRIANLAEPPQIDYTSHSYRCDCLLVPIENILYSQAVIEKTTSLPAAITQAEKENQLFDDQLFG